MSPLFSSFLAPPLSWFLQRLFFALAKTTLPSVPDKGTALVLAPHPDDETLGCGASIARLRQQGVPVVLVVVTDGTASAPASVIAADALAARRKEEVLLAAERLGLSMDSLVFLNVPDSKAEQNSEDIRRELQLLIERLKPSLIFSPSLLDGHSDHRAVARVVRALQKKGALQDAVLLEYPLWFWPKHALKLLVRPWLLRFLIKSPTAPYAEQKEWALQAHVTQIKGIEPQENAQACGQLSSAFLQKHRQAYELFFLCPPPRTPFPY